MTPLLLFTPSTTNLSSAFKTHTQTKTHTSVPLGGWCETLSPQALHLTSTPLWSVTIHSLTVEGIGHITSSPPHRTEALHLTLENVQASSSSGLRRGARFRLRDEGQYTTASLHAEELCCFWDRRSFLSFYLWLKKADLWGYIPLTLWQTFCIQIFRLGFRSSFIIDGLIMRYHQKCNVTLSAAVLPSRCPHI